MVSAQKMLPMLPVRNASARITRTRRGGMIVEIPLNQATDVKRVIRWAAPKDTNKRIELDAIGARVLDLIDGQKTVEAIIEDFAIENRLSFREAQLPVMQFLYSLIQRGVVSLREAEEH